MPISAFSDFWLGFLFGSNEPDCDDDISSSACFWCNHAMECEECPHYHSETR